LNYFIPVLNRNHKTGANMTFKENLLKKIRIDQLAKKVLKSIRPADSGQKTDRSSMRLLLESGPFEFLHQRDLDLYNIEPETDAGLILVLDNELAIYKTDIQDVLLRKSPYIKEMISIRNAIKILSDADVVVSRKTESVNTVHQLCLARLNLTFQPADIEMLADDGVMALKQEDVHMLEETLMLFDALLGFNPLPKRFRIAGCLISGRADRSEQNKVCYTPVIIYNKHTNELKLIAAPIFDRKKSSIDLIHTVVKGETDAFKEGPAVMEYLKDTAIKRDHWDIAKGDSLSD
jgi:hypothetical protein